MSPREKRFFMHTLTMGIDEAERRIRATDIDAERYDLFHRRPKAIIWVRGLKLKV